MKYSLKNILLRLTINILSGIFHPIAAHTAPAGAAMGPIHREQPDRPLKVHLPMLLRHLRRFVGHKSTPGAWARASAGSPARHQSAEARFTGNKGEASREAKNSNDRLPWQQGENQRRFHRGAFVFQENQMSKTPFSIRLEPELIEQLEMDAKRGFRTASQEIAMRLAHSYEDKISVRDYFAAKALQGLCANPGGPFQASAARGWAIVNCTVEQIADEAYGIADAMLKARA